MSIDAQPASPQVFKVELIYDHFWVQCTLQHNNYHVK